MLRWLQRFSKPKLDADLLRRIRASFEAAAADEEHFPSTIDPRIFHVQLILRHLGDLSGKRVLDVGCGKGRFARIVKERYPRSLVFGLDLAEAMLRCAPSSVIPILGSMTALPMASGSMDAVYATESLEHAVDIEAAVAEMCRVLKPEGRLVIIDKNADQWGRLETPPWEKWFRKGELEKLLRRHCRNVSSQYISYWEDVAPDRLFIAWLAEK